MTEIKKLIVTNNYVNEIFINLTITKYTIIVETHKIYPTFQIQEDCLYVNITDKYSSFETNYELKLEIIDLNCKNTNININQDCINENVNLQLITKNLSSIKFNKRDDDEKNPFYNMSILIDFNRQNNYYNKIEFDLFNMNLGIIKMIKTSKFDLDLRFILNINKNTIVDLTDFNNQNNAFYNLKFDLCIDDINHIKVLFPNYYINAKFTHIDIDKITKKNISHNTFYSKQFHLQNLTYYILMSYHYIYKDKYKIEQTKKCTNLCIYCGEMISDLILDCNHNCMCSICANNIYCKENKILCPICNIQCVIAKAIINCNDKITYIDCPNYIIEENNNNENIIEDENR